MNLGFRVLLWYFCTAFFSANGFHWLRHYWREGHPRQCAPWLLALAGTLSNLVCILANGNRMPVVDWNQPLNDGLHSLATSGSHLMLLADVHHLGSARYSLGDVLLLSSVATWLGTKLWEMYGKREV